jgi:anti-sigma factor ChrR (cupin superfamily)
VKLTLDDLHDYVLGVLPDAERHALDAEVARSPELQAEVRAVRETLFGHTVSNTKATPSGAATAHPDARARLLGALDSGARYAPFIADLTRAFDLAAARVRELCDLIDAPSSWQAGPLPGIQVMHFAGGPNAVAPDTGFVRLPAGLQFPYHRHVGHEINYVLEGAVRDGDGTLYLPGEAIVMAPGTAHSFSVPEDADALIAVVQAGFELIAPP